MSYLFESDPTPVVVNRKIFIATIAFVAIFSALFGGLFAKVFPTKSVHTEIIETKRIMDEETFDEAVNRVVQSMDVDSLLEAALDAKQQEIRDSLRSGCLRGETAVVTSIVSEKLRHTDDSGWDWRSTVSFDSGITCTFNGFWAEEVWDVGQEVSAEGGKRI